ncbi:hypothetical protein M422DRAFT_273108 [Sphaerobolus stellatus SS14]|uniref:Uncharacterized protein n=1 Tax=Sphaerobolus stellatus (strain SS14) TaxID=990650 RepID=A0A0C9U9Y0_SPHS4|nr:hypothetical protein M422DRAFT_273108 [Sphaerobolus stellatus SS14]
MAPRKAGVKRRLTNLGDCALKKLKSDIPQPYLEDSVSISHQESESDSEDSSYAPCPSPAPSYSSLSDFDDVDLKSEAELYQFSMTLQKGMLNFLKTKRRTFRYSRVGPKSERTQRCHQAETRHQTKKLREQGYQDIERFFKRPPNPTKTVPDPLIREEEEEEEEDGGDEVGSGALLDLTVETVEEEEEEEEQQRMVTENRCYEREEEEEESDEDEVAEMTCAPSLAPQPLPLITARGPQNPAHVRQVRPPEPKSAEVMNAVQRMTHLLKDKKRLDLLTRARITSMLAFLQFHNAEGGGGWIQASLLAATAAGKGATFACTLCAWTWAFLENSGELPANLFHGLWRQYFSAADVRRFPALPDTRERFQLERVPSLRTAQRWLYAMSYRYGKAKNGMYVDGHGREGVIAYRQSVFLPLWSSMEARMVTWTSDNIWIEPNLQPGEKRIILVTHDESIFYANDRRSTHWIHKDEKPEPVRKGEGTSIMVSDFCLPELGWLKSKDGSDEARLLFRVGKNRDGYFDNSHLMVQVEKAIKLIHDNFGDTAIAAFGFNNAPSHQERAPDALSARHMPKNPKLWNRKEGVRMRDTSFGNNEHQSFYFSDDHPRYPGYFKGMRIILEEQGFKNVAKLPAQCGKNFKCEDTRLDASCCCRRILFNQKDFLEQKSALIELVE